MSHLIGKRNSFAALALVAGLGIGPGLSVSAAADTAPAPAAHWVERKLDYTYMGFTSKYSCDGLQDNVRDVLLALGARKADLTVYPRGCSRLNGPEPFPGVSAHFWVLEPLKPDEIAKVGDSGAQAAQWQNVDLTRLHGPSSEQGQCELLEQLKLKALPLFASRNLNFQSSCVPHQVTLGDITFQVDVLRPALPVATPPSA